MAYTGSSIGDAVIAGARESQDGSDLLRAPGGLLTRFATRVGSGALTELDVRVRAGVSGA